MITGSEFHEFLSYSDPLMAVLSLIFNVYLIYLIIAKSPKEFGSYKYLLVFSSIFEIAYAFLEAYLVPIHYSAGTSDIVLVSLTDKSLSRFMVRMLNSAYWGGFGATQSIYAVHFIYRYLGVTRNPYLASFNSWKLLLWLQFPTAMELVRESVLISFGKPIDTFDYLGGTMYDISKDGRIVPHYGFLIAVAIMSTAVSISFAIIIYCAVMCYSLIQKMMNRTTTVSSKSRALQSQLFYALIFQIAIPTVFLNGPLTIFLALNVANSGIKGYSGYLDFAISLYPVIDPLPNFFVIKPYKKAFFGCLRKNKVANAATTYMNSEIQLDNITRNLD